MLSCCRRQVIFDVNRSRRETFDITFSHFVPTPSNDGPWRELSRVKERVSRYPFNFLPFEIVQLIRNKVIGFDRFTRLEGGFQLAVADRGRVIQDVTSRRVIDTTHRFPRNLSALPDIVIGYPASRLAPFY